MVLIMPKGIRTLSAEEERGLRAGIGDCQFWPWAWAWSPSRWHADPAPNRALHL